MSDEQALETGESGPIKKIGPYKNKASRQAAKKRGRDAKSLTSAGQKSFGGT